MFSFVLLCYFYETMIYYNFSWLQLKNNHIKSLEETLKKETSAHLCTKEEYTYTKYMLEGVRQSFTHYLEKTDNEIQDLKREKTDLQTEKQALLLRYLTYYGTVFKSCLLCVSVVRVSIQVLLLSIRVCISIRSY